MIDVVFSAEARADAIAVFAFYERRREGLGLRFRDHLDRALEKIRQDPARYPVVYRELRRRLIERFPYAIFYRVYTDMVFVVAVMHGKRTSARWKSRANAKPPGAP